MEVVYIFRACTQSISAHLEHTQSLGRDKYNIAICYIRYFQIFIFYPLNRDFVVSITIDICDLCFIELYVSYDNKENTFPAVHQRRGKVAKELEFAK